MIAKSDFFLISSFSGNARLNSQRGSRQNIMTWPNQTNSKSCNRSLRVNGLFGGGKKDNNSEDGQSKVTECENLVQEDCKLISNFCVLWNL